MINDELRLTNPVLQTFEEQVRPAQHLLKPPHIVLADWDTLYRGQFQLCHADHWGAACTRPRMLKLSKGDAPVDLSAIKHRPPVDINALLEPGWRSPTPLAKCVVSSERTHNPPVVYDPEGQVRQLYEGEADRVMGYPDGVSYPGYAITP